MLECWQEEPGKRPSFTKLRARFDTMLMAEKNDTYIDLQIDASKPYYNPDPTVIAEDNFLNINKASPNPSKRISATSPFHMMGISPSHSDFMESFTSITSGQRSSRSPSPVPASEKTVVNPDAGTKQQKNVYVDDPSLKQTPNELQVIRRGQRSSQDRFPGRASGHSARPASLQLESGERNVYVDSPSVRRSVHISPPNWSSSGYLPMEIDGTMINGEGTFVQRGGTIDGISSGVREGVSNVTSVVNGEIEEGGDGSTLPEILISLN